MTTTSTPETMPSDTAEKKTTSAPETTADKPKGKARKAKGEHASASHAAPGGGKKKKGSKGKAKKARKAAPGASYSNVAPKGMFAVGAMVKYVGGAKLKNAWLTKGMVGRVYGYRPGRQGGGLYAIRFEGGATLLSAKRVEKVTTKG